MAINYDYANENANSSEYCRPAGFWLRVWATFFDTALISIPKCLVDGAATIYLTAALEKVANQSSQSADPLFGIVLPLALYMTFTIGSSLALSILYYPLMESSRIQGTPGKRFLCIAVTDRYGERISFARALGRHFARWISLLPSIMAMIIIVVPLLFGQQPGAAAAIAIILAAIGTTVLALIHYPMAAFTSDKQALHDKIAKTYVVRFSELSMGNYTLRALVSIIVAIVVPITVGLIVHLATGSQTGNSQEHIMERLMPLFEGAKRTSGSGSNDAEKSPGWREIKPIWRDKSSAPPKPNSPTRLNLALVTIKPKGTHVVSFDSSKAIAVGFEPLKPVEEVQAGCSNNCVTIVSGDQTQSGATAKIVAQPKKGQVHVTLKNNEAFPIEVVVYRESAPK